MGGLPESRLKRPPTFMYILVDLFGPYKFRGKVRKRARGKEYEFIFTDMVSRAVKLKQSTAMIPASF